MDRSCRLLKWKHGYGAISSGEWLISISIETQQSSAIIQQQLAFSIVWLNGNVCSDWAQIRHVDICKKLTIYLIITYFCNLPLFIHEEKHKRNHSIDLCSYRIMVLTLV